VRSHYRLEVVRRTAAICGLVVVGAVLVACNSADVPSPPVAQATQTSEVITPTTTTTTTTVRLKPDTDLEAVCKGKPFPAGAAFTGAPPHPMQAHGFGTLYGEYDEWPEPWGSWAPGKVDAGLVQLVMCEEALEAEKTDLVCRYKPAFGSGRTKSYKVELEVVSLKLYEVRTAKLLTEVKVTGPRECSETASTREGESFVTSFTEVGAYAEAVRKYVLG
jgi:hypothetical protein